MSMSLCNDLIIHDLEWILYEVFQYQRHTSSILEILSFRLFNYKINISRVIFT